MGTAEPGTTRMSTPFSSNVKLHAPNRSSVGSDRMGMEIDQETLESLEELEGEESWGAALVTPSKRSFDTF